MKFAFFKGCKIPYYLSQYETSTRSVLKNFGVKLVDLDFNCCGYPNRDIDFASFVLSSARNMALAEKENLDIVTPCKCCFGSLKNADYFLRENDRLRRDINSVLEQEGLSWKGEHKVKHLLSVLSEDVGLDKISKSIVIPQTGLHVAAHYGCHALRPSNVVHFDDPLSPSIFEDLVAVTGAETVEWSRRLDCCGNPLWGKNDAISLALMQTKISDAHESGADCLCTACTYCQIQFDEIQHTRRKENGASPVVPAILYSQLLGLSMGLQEKVLGISHNRIALPQLSWK